MEIDQNIFFDEFKNKIISLENALIDVKSGNYTDEVINEVFRSIHTVKGTADLLGMFILVSVTHKAEDVLDDVRNKKLLMDDTLCSLFIEFKDYIALSIDNLSMGIFDDEVCDNLAVYFEKEFNTYLHKALNQVIEETTVQTILVVEESTFIRYSIKKIALEHGYNAIITDNSEDAMKKILKYPIDLIICDFSSSQANNKTFINKIVNSLEFDAIPIVMLIDKITLELKEYGKQISAKAWLNKPINEDKLLFILDKILKE